MPRKIIYSPVIAALVAVMAGCGPPPSNSSSETTSDRTNTTESGDEQSRVKAKPGVGKKGQLIEKHDGPISTPVKAYFKAEQQLAFMNATRALQLYQAAKGREFPKSTEEYMREVIEPNRIKLPELPEGAHYEYDPKTSELMVVTVPAEYQVKQ